MFEETKKTATQKKVETQTAKTEAARQKILADEPTTQDEEIRQEETAPEEDNFLAEMNEEKEIPTGNVFDNLPATQDDGELTPHKVNDAQFLEKLFDEIEDKPTTELAEITATYLDLNDFKPGEERTMVFTGITTFTTESDEVKPAVKLAARGGLNFICASVVIVKALMSVEKVPCAIRIKVNGKIKGKNGSYFDVKVFVF